MRTRIVLAGMVAAVASGVVMTASSAAAPAATRLIGVVGIHDAYKITLKNAKGKNVKTLKAGTYTIKVTDGSRLHNFVLEGPGVEKDITTVGFKGTKTVTVKLRVGRYKFYCRPHESSMFGYVKVT